MWLCCLIPTLHLVHECHACVTIHSSNAVSNRASLTYNNANQVCKRRMSKKPVELKSKQQGLRAVHHPLAFRVAASKSLRCFVSLRGPAGPSHSLANARNKYLWSEEKMPTVHRCLSAAVPNSQFRESYQPRHKQYRTNAAQTHEVRLRQYRWALRLGPVLHALVPLAVDSIAVQYHTALFIQSDSKEFIYRRIRQFQFGI